MDRPFRAAAWASHADVDGLSPNVVSLQIFKLGDRSIKFVAVLMRLEVSFAIHLQYWASSFEGCLSLLYLEDLAMNRQEIGHKMCPGLGEILTLCIYPTTRL
jgi:hypothetical protein